MGFRMERSVYNLVFDDGAFEGLTIRVRAMSMQEYLDNFARNWETGDSAEERKRKQDERLQSFLDHVVEWDLEDENGNPVPVTLDGLRSACEPEQAGTIIGVWMNGRQKVPAPLEPRSPGSSLSAIPMTVLPSTPEPVSSIAS